VKREHKLTTKVVLAVIFESSQSGEETEKDGPSAQLYHLDREGAEINDILDHSKGYDSGLLEIGTESEHFHPPRMFPGFAACGLLRD
jgi:hypothetical protein